MTSFKYLPLYVASSIFMASTVTAQDDKTPAVEMSAKLEKYHQLLQKRPSSKPLFQRFQTAWLAKHGEAELEKFLQQKSVIGNNSDKQLYALFLTQQGKDTDALQILSKVVKADAENAQAWLDRAQCYARVIDFEKAVADVEQAIKHGEGDEFILQANKLKGRYLMRSAKDDEAIKHWVDLAKKNQGDEDLVEDVIDILAADGLFEAALEMAKNLTQKSRDPYKKAMRTLRVADILQKQGSQDKAIEVYKETIEVSGVGSWLEREIIAQLEMLYLREDNVKGLIVSLEELCKKYPQRSYITQKYADILVSDEQFKKAKLIYQNLLKTHPDDSNMRLAYLKMLKEAGDSKTALSMLDKLIAKDQKNLQLYLQRAELAGELADKENVLKSLEGYKSHAQPTGATAILYAELLHKYGFKDKVEQAYADALEQYPDSIEVLFKVSAYYFEKEQKDKAKVVWKKIAAQGDKDALVRLFEVLLGSGEQALALEITTSALPKYKTDVRFIKAACQVAEANKKYEDAVKWSRSLLLLSMQPTELDSALNLVTRIIQKAEMQEKVLKDILAKKQIPISEKCLCVEIYEQLGDVVKSNNLLEEIQDGSDPIGFIQSARVYERRYDLEKAAQSIEKLIAQGGGAKPVFMKRLVELHERTGNPEKALLAVRKWKTVTPNDKAAWFSEVELLESTRTVNEALNALRRGMERFEDDPEVRGKLAELYSRSGKNKQSMQLYWRLYDDANDMSDRIRWSGMLAETANNTGKEGIDELVDELNRRRRTNPKSVAPLLALAEVYRVNEQHQQRRNILLEALRIRPEDVELMVEIANADEREGNVTKALELLQKALPFDKTGSVQRKLARLYMEEGDYEKGLDVLSSAGGKNSSARQSESIVLSLMKQYAHEEARVYLQEELKKYPEDWRLLYLSCLIDYDLGHMKECSESLLKLLNMNNKLTGVTRGWDTPYYASNYKNRQFGLKYDSYLARDFYSAQEAKSSYTNLRNAGSSSSYYYRGYNRGGLAQNLPMQVEGVHLMAKLLLIDLLDEVNKNQQAVIHAELKRLGVKHLDLLSYASVTNYYNRWDQIAEHISEKMQKQPDDIALAELFIVTKVHSNKFRVSENDLKYLQQVAKKFPENKAYAKAVSLFISEKTKIEEYNKQLCDAFSKEQTISDRAVDTLIHWNSEAFYNRSKKPLQKEVWDVLKRYYEENKHLTEKSANAPQLKTKLRKVRQIKRLLVQELYRKKDMPGVIKALEDGLIAYGKTHHNRYYPSYRGNQTEYKPIEFPPQDLTNASSTQLSALHPKSQIIDKKALKPHLDQFTNPILKVLAAYYCDKDANLEPYFKDIRENEKYKADAYFIEALWRNTRNEKLGVLLPLLEQARNATISKSQRSEINRVIRTLAMLASVKDIKALDDESLQIAQASARRAILMRSVNQVEEISFMLNKLQMEKERSRFINKKNKVTSGGYHQNTGVVGLNYNRYNNYRNARATFAEKFNKEITTGSKERAVKIVSKYLQSQMSNASYNRYDVEQAVRLVEQYNLQNKVLQKFDPNTSASPRKWLKYFELAKYFKDEEKQKKAISKLQKMEYTPVSVRVPLAIALVDSDPKRAKDLLAGARNLSGLFEAFSEQLQRDYNKPEKCLNVLEMTVAAVEARGMDKVFNQDTSNGFWNFFDEVKSLHGYGWRTYKKFPRKEQEKQKRYDKAALFMARLSLMDSNTAEEGFKLLYAINKKLEDSEKMDLLALAKQSLTASRSQSNISGGEEEKLKDHPDRVTYILKYVRDEKDVKAIDEAFLRKIVSDTNLRDTLKTARTYILKTDAELIAEIDKKLKSAKVKESDYTAIRTLVKLLDKDELNQRFAIYTLHAVEAEMANASNTDWNFQQTLARDLSEAAGIAVAAGKTKQIDRLFSKLLAKTPKGEAALDYWINKISSYRWSSHYMRDSDEAVVQLFRALTAEPKSLAYAAKKAKEYHYPLQFFENTNSELADGKRVFEQLKELGYLTSLETWRGKTLLGVTLTPKQLVKAKKEMSNHNQFSVVKYDIQVLLNRFVYRKHYSDDRKQFQTLVKSLRSAKQEEKMYADMLLVMLQEMTLHGFLNKHKKVILSLEEEQKQLLSDIFRVSDDVKVQLELKKHNLESLLPVDKEKANKEAKEAVAEYLKRERSDDQLDVNSAVTEVVQLLQYALEFDQTSALKILQKHIELLEVAPQNSHRRGRTAFFYNTHHHATGATPLHNSLYRIVQTISQTGGSPFQLNRLLYQLSKQEDRHSLNLASLVKASCHRDWMSNRNSGKLDPVVETLVSYAKELYAIEDEQERLFHFAAWASYMSTNQYPHDLGSNFRSNYSGRNIKKAVEIYEQGKEFYEWVYAVKDFAGTGSSYFNYDLRKPYTLIDNATSHKDVPQVVKSVVQKMSPESQLLFIENTASGISYMQHFEGSEWLRKLSYNVYVNSIQGNVEMAHCFDHNFYLRAMAQYHYMYSAEEQKKLANLGAEALQKMMEQIDSKGLIHHQQLTHAAGLASITPEGAKYLAMQVNQNFDRFQTQVRIAQMLFNHGYLNEAKRVLVSKNSDFNQLGNSWVCFRKGAEKHLQPFLGQYNSANEKLLAGYLIVTMPDSSAKESRSQMSLRERCKTLALSLAGQHSKVAVTTKVLLDDLLGFYDADVSVKQQQDYILAKNVLNLKHLSKNSQNTMHHVSYSNYGRNIRSFNVSKYQDFGYEKHLWSHKILAHLSKGEVKEMTHILDELEKMYKAKKSYNSNESVAHFQTYKMIYLYCYALYAQNKDDELKKWLPIFRRAQSQSRMNYYKERLQNISSFSEAMHKELGEEKAYAEWKKELGLKNLLNKLSGTSQSGLTKFLSDGYNRRSQSLYVSPQDRDAILRRMYSNPVVQARFLSSSRQQSLISIFMDTNSGHFDWSQALTLLESLKVEHENPVFAAIVHRDKAFASLGNGNTEKALRQFDQMLQVLNEHEPKKVSVNMGLRLFAAEGYLRLGKKEKIQSLFSQELLDKANRSDVSKMKSILKKAEK